MAAVTTVTGAEGVAAAARNALLMRMRRGFPEGNAGWRISLGLPGAPPSARLDLVRSPDRVGLFDAAGRWLTTPWATSGGGLVVALVRGAGAMGEPKRWPPQSREPLPADGGPDDMTKAEARASCIDPRVVSTLRKHCP